MLNNLTISFTHPLTIVYQQSRKIPDIWSQDFIVPIYKGKRNRLDISSYRPISLKSVICSKVLEKLIVRQMRDYIHAKKLIDDCRNGFMIKKSKVTNLLACDVKLADILNSDHPADLFFLDFTRAFDKVDHIILLKKLYGFCIQGYSLK